MRYNIKSYDWIFAGCIEDKREYIRSKEKDKRKYIRSKKMEKILKQIFVYIIWNNNFR